MGTAFSSPTSRSRRQPGRTIVPKPAAARIQLLLAPWLVGLAVAPLLFGAVNPAEQAIVTLLLGASFCLVAPQLGGSKLGSWPALLMLFCAMGIAVLPLVNLPINVVALLSPEAAATARQFVAEDISQTTLSISRTATVHRVWELTMLVICFMLARFAAARARIDRALILTLAATVLLLAGAEAWRRISGGPKPGSAGRETIDYAFGLFANRNHYANWIAVASIFLLGALWRAFSRSEPREQRGKAEPLFTALIIVAIVFSVVMAVTSGSRAGTGAFCIGVIAWLALSVRKVREQRAKLFWLCGAATLVVTVAVGSQMVFERVAKAGDDIDFKQQIWSDALRIAVKLPLFGVGAGSFERASNYYKTFGGEKTFLHVENDYVELLAECGFFFSAILLGLLGRSLWHIWKLRPENRVARPELILSAQAALLVFLAHATVEFVFQITATALLGATMFGYLLGMRDRSSEPIVVVPPLWRVLINYAIGVALLAAATAQLLAAHHFRRGIDASSHAVASQEIVTALKWWPWNSDRALALARVEAARLRKEGSDPTLLSSDVMVTLARRLADDPWDWRLRVELFVLKSRSGVEPEQLREEAWRITKLNPLQPVLPLFFARYFASATDPAAVDFLKQASRFPNNLPQVLALAWNFDQDTGLLWSLTPNNDAGMQQLGDFAASRQMFGMARLAYGRQSDALPPIARAENFLKAQQPELVLKTVVGHTLREQLLRARSHMLMGNFVEAIHEAEAAWLDESAAMAHPKFKTLGASPEEITAAEEIFSHPAKDRDLPRLRQIAAQAPQAHRIKWMIFETERELGRFDAAARAAIDLAADLAKETPAK